MYSKLLIDIYDHYMFTNLNKKGSQALDIFKNKPFRVIDPKRVVIQ